MPSELEEANYWASKAADSHHNTLDDARASASKWQAGIATFLGGYATVAFLSAPSTITDVTSNEWIKCALVAAIVIAAVLGAYATSCANRAANGIPRVEVGRPLTGAELAQETTGAAKYACAMLQRAITLAGISGAIAVAAAVATFSLGVFKSSPATHAVFTDATTNVTYCGTPVTDNGQVKLMLSDGSEVGVTATYTVVQTCPDS